jgi:hypothetical protein
MQNCNTTPFLLTSEGNPDPKNFPSYMVQESDNLRGEISRRILAENQSLHLKIGDERDSTHTYSLRTSICRNCLVL